MLEARPVGRRPVSVTHHAGAVAEACHGAAGKLYDLLDRVYDRAHHHKGGRTIRHREAAAAAVASPATTLLGGETGLVESGARGAGRPDRR